MAKEIFVAYGIDVDAVAGWLGSYGGQDSPCDITRGMFAGEVGSLRLLRLFEKWGIKTTWFIPGHSIETFPDQMKTVADAGHEIGMHGYSHENPVATTPEQEEAIFDKCIEVITKLAGKPPRGYVAPWWELGPNTGGAAPPQGAQVRSLDDEQRLPPVLCPGRGFSGPRSTIPSTPRPG